MEVPYDWLQATLHVTRKRNKLGKDKNLAPVVQKVDNAIHWINHYPLDSAIGFPDTYPVDSDLSGG